jgi:predicted molibdopterin-dependent oxidoreductase YjgC
MVSGGVRALYVMGADPAGESDRARQALQRLDFLVVQDLFLSETAQLADVVLPAASSFIEADGTFTNLEGRVQRSLAGNRPRGEAVADWSILLHLARAWPQPVVEEVAVKAKGQKVKGKSSVRRTSGWEYDSLAAVLTEITRVVPAYADLTWPALGSQGQPGGAKPSTNRRFQAVTLRAAGHDGAYPLSLVTGTRLFDGGTLTQASTTVAQLVPAPFVGLHPTEAQQMSLVDGQAVTVSSPAGQVSLSVRIDESVQPGTAWVLWGQAGEPAGALLADKATTNVKVA